MREQKFLNKLIVLEKKNVSRPTDNRVNIRLLNSKVNTNSVQPQF